MKRNIKHTWRVQGGGHRLASVVADEAQPGTFDDELNVRAYGGHLVAESIGAENQALIAAAPSLLAFFQLTSLGTKRAVLNALDELNPEHRERIVAAAGGDE